MYKYVVTSLERLTPAVMLLTVGPQRAGKRLQHQAGQYAAIGFKSGGRPSPVRCFSITNAPDQSGELQFAIRILGSFTQAISRLQPGDEMVIYGPFGQFVIDERYDRAAVLMAGGIGITPFMSMIREHAQRRSAAPIALLYSCATQDDIPFYDEITQLARLDPYFNVTFFVTHGPTDKLVDMPVRTERIPAGPVTQRATADATYFLCGPQGFIADLRSGLLAAGVGSDRIVAEEFTPSKADEALSVRFGWSVRRITYGLAAGSVVVAVILVMSLDLVRAVPRLAGSSSTQSQPAATSNVQTQSSTFHRDDSGDDSSSQSSTPVTNTPQTTYQQPVSSVS